VEGVGSVTRSFGRLDHQTLLSIGHYRPNLDKVHQVKHISGSSAKPQKRFRLVLRDTLLVVSFPALI